MSVCFECLLICLLQSQPAEIGDHVVLLRVVELPDDTQTLQGGAGVVARAGTVGAATFLTTLPSILVFAFMRGKVMETMSYSGIKS